MKTFIAVCFAVILGVGALGPLSSGCGNSSPAAPVTVTLQPTPACGGQLGYGVLSTGGISSTGYINSYPVTLAAASKTLDMAVYLGASATGNIELSVYSDNAGVPNTFMDGGAITSPAINSWNIAVLSGQNLPAGKYWLAIEHQGTIDEDYGSNTNTPVYQVTQAYGIPPLTMPSGTAIASAAPIAILLDTVCQ
jgi:hypothetical protein